MATRARASERAKRHGGVRLGRADRSAFGTWFWEIDRVLLALVTLLIAIGLVAVAAASPAASARDNLPPLFYFTRQLIWVALGVPVMIGVSMLPQATARRLSIAGAALFLVALMLVPVIGIEVNGARRWIGGGAFRLQPSEFLKPLFVVSMAWLLSFRMTDRSLPVTQLSFVLVGLIGLLLMKQPDFGQTVIFVSVWLTLLLLSGVSTKVLAGLGAAGLGAVVCAYLFYSVARERIDGFVHGTGDTYHVDRAMATITNGGLVGVGPGGGTEKFRLPEAHNDYIFSVIGEEFGLISCLVIAILYLAVVVRVFVKLLDEEDAFLTLAAAGLATQFGLQALVNMAVNVQIAPSKGMTLPFISYGGSSVIAVSIGFGLLLAFTRRNPYLKRSPYVVKWNGR